MHSATVRAMRIVCVYLPFILFVLNNLIPFNLIIVLIFDEPYMNETLSM